MRANRPTNRPTNHKPTCLSPYRTQSNKIYRCKTVRKTSNIITAPFPSRTTSCHCAPVLLTHSLTRTYPCGPHRLVHHLILCQENSHSWRLQFHNSELYFRSRAPNLCSHRRCERDLVFFPTHFYRATMLQLCAFARHSAS